MTSRIQFVLTVPLLVGLVACEDKKEEQRTEVVAPESPQVPEPVMERGKDREEEESNIEKIAERPRAQYGKSMTLEGEVEKVISDRAFRLEEKDELWGDEVLVLLKNDANQQVKEGDELKVVGTVHKMITAEIEREVNWDLTEDIEAEYKEKPVVVAETVTQLHPGS